LRWTVSRAVDATGARTTKLKSANAPTAGKHTRPLLAQPM
jgi:hypothetical protein